MLKMRITQGQLCLKLVKINILDYTEIRKFFSQKICLLKENEKQIFWDIVMKKREVSGFMVWYNYESIIMK